MKFFCMLVLVLLLLQDSLAARPPSRKALRVKPSSTTSPSTAKRGRPAGQSTSPPVNYGAFETLSELVSNRPHRSKKGPTKRYIEAFATHRDVKAIDLHQVNSGKLAQELFNLRDSQQTQGWQRSMTHTVQDYLQHEGVDEKTIEDVLGYYWGQRTKSADRRRKEKRKAIDLDTVEKGNMYSTFYYALNREKIPNSRRQRKQFVEDLDELVYAHPNKHPSVKEVAHIAEALRTKFPQDNMFHTALKNYLRVNKYPSEDIDVAQGTRSMQIDRRRWQKPKAEGRVASNGGGSLALDTNQKASSIGLQGDRRRASSTRGTDKTSANAGRRALDRKGEEKIRMKQSVKAESSPGPSKEQDKHLEPGAWWNDSLFDNL